MKIVTRYEDPKFDLFDLTEGELECLYNLLYCQIHYPNDKYTPLQGLCERLFKPIKEQLDQNWKRKKGVTREGE